MFVFAGFMHDFVEIVGSLLLLEAMIRGSAHGYEVVGDSVSCIFHVSCCEKLFLWERGGVRPYVWCLLHFDSELRSWSLLRAQFRMAGQLT